MLCAVLPAVSRALPLAELCVVLTAVLSAALLAVSRALPFAELCAELTAVYPLLLSCAPGVLRVRP